MQNKINYLRTKATDAIEQCIMTNRSVPTMHCRMVEDGTHVSSEALHRHPHDFC